MTKTDDSEIRVREAMKADVPRVAELIMIQNSDAMASQIGDARNLADEV